MKINTKFIGVSLLLLTGCAPPVPYCNSNQILGNDNNCYSCNVGTPELYGYTFGTCSSFNSGGVACCVPFTGWTGIGETCNTGYCWTSANNCCPVSKPFFCGGLCYANDTCGSLIIACF